MNIRHLISGMILCGLFISCGGNSSEGTKFDPAEKESNMTDKARAEAIAAKKKGLNNLNVDSIWSLNGVKFSVLPPEINANLPQNACEAFTSKIINIAGENGIGGFCTNPVLGLVSKVDCVENGMTGTAPQKAIVKYEITLYCGNFITNDIYASTTVSLTGVGNNFDHASRNAVNELKNTPEIKSMFKTAATNALKWYNNESNLKRIVDKAVAEQNYGLAMALLSSVPSEATETFNYAVNKNEEVTELFFQSKADELLAKMKSYIAESSSKGEYNPEVGACLSLISQRSKAYAEANKLYNEYMNSVEADYKDKLARSRNVEDQNMANAHQLNMEEIALQKVKAQYEAEATIAQINADARVAEAKADAEGKKNANTGGFLGMGKLWDGAFGIANRLMDGDD